MQWQLSSTATPGAPTQHLGLLWQSQNGGRAAANHQSPVGQQEGVGGAGPEDAQGVPTASQHQVAGSHKVQTGTVPA